MKKRVWIAISSILAFVPLLIPLARGHGLAPVEKWAARYNGPGNEWDRANAIAVDGLGNVYVTGWSMGSGSNYDYATIKYNINGEQLWVATYNGPGNGIEEANAIAVDSLGNVYVTGRSRGSGTNYDYATIKYNTNGKELWVKRYDGPLNGGDIAYAIAVDGSGNIYVTGGSQGSDYYDDCATIKYNTNGKQLWVKRYSGPGKSHDFARAMAVDGSGNVYVTGDTGESWGSGTDIDYATIKYNPNGKQLWVKRYNGPANREDTASAMAVDGLGNVYVTGSSYVSGTDIDYATIKYNTNGKQLWAKRYNGPANREDTASAMAVDGSGNVYVTGSSVVSGTRYDYATLKYSPNGKQLWVKRYNGPGNSNGANAIAVDGSGNVYVTGRSDGSGTSGDYATIKYNTNGGQLWVKRYNGQSNWYGDEANAIAVDGSGNVYVTGDSGGSSTQLDYVTIKY
jgi:uncharacterized delta-60 repeat protein